MGGEEEEEEEEEEGGGEEEGEEEEFEDGDFDSMDMENLMDTTKQTRAGRYLNEGTPAATKSGTPGRRSPSSSIIREKGAEKGDM